MATGISVDELQTVLDGVLEDGPQPQAILLIHATRRFPDCDAGALADALEYVLGSRYVHVNHAWRRPWDSSEAAEHAERWREDSERRRGRLLRAVRGGRALDAFNQFELAAWIENAVQSGEEDQAHRLFPLLKRDCFTEERWFEIQGFFEASSKNRRTIEQLTGEVAGLKNEVRVLKQRVAEVQGQILSREAQLKELGGKRVPDGDRKRPSDWKERRHQFFTRLAEEFAARHPGMRPRKAGYESWISLKSGPFGSFGVSFARDGRLRADVYLDLGSATPTKPLFDGVAADREAIEQAFGSPLAWERLDGRRACRIVAYRPAPSLGVPADEEAAAQWAVDSVIRLVELLDERLRRGVRLLEGSKHGDTENAERSPAAD